MKYFLLLALLVGVYAEEGRSRYDGYTVYRLVPTTDEQLDALRQLENEATGVS